MDPVLEGAAFLLNFWGVLWNQLVFRTHCAVLSERATKITLHSGIRHRVCWSVHQIPWNHSGKHIKSVKTIPRSVFITFEKYAVLTLGSSQSFQSLLLRLQIFYSILGSSFGLCIPVKTEDFNQAKYFSVKLLKTFHDAHLLGNVQISLSEVGLLSVPIGDGVSNFDDASTPRLKDRIQAINYLHPAGFVRAAFSDVKCLGKNTTKVLFAPASTVCQASGEQQRGHLYLLSNWKETYYGITKKYNSYKQL